MACLPHKPWQKENQRSGCAGSAYLTVPRPRVILRRIRGQSVVPESHLQRKFLPNGSTAHDLPRRIPLKECFLQYDS